MTDKTNKTQTLNSLGSATFKPENKISMENCYKNLPQATLFQLTCPLITAICLSKVLLSNPLSF